MWDCGFATDWCSGGETLQPWWILSKNTFLDELGHVNLDFSCPRSWVVLRGMIEKITPTSSKPRRNNVFEQYSTLFDAGYTTVPIGEEIQTPNRRIILFTLEKKFFLIVFHRKRQSDVRIGPASLYIRKSRWNELFQNVYDGFEILNRYEDLELPRKVGKFLTRSVNNVLLTRDLRLLEPDFSP